MADPIVRINCPTCNRKLKIPERSIKKAIVCPRCNSTFRIEGQSSTIVVEGRNDLFGPPVSDEYSKGGYGSDPFGEIEKIVSQYDDSSGEPDDELVAAKSRDSKRPKTMRQLDEQSKANAANSKGGGRSYGKGDGESPTKTAKEKSLANNAIGLMILSFGLSLLPLAAGAVPWVQEFLPMLLAAALLLAFLSCFMLAYSRRRENMASVILAVMPLLFVGFLSFGTYYLANNFLPNLDTANLLDGNDDDDAGPFFEPEPPLNLDGDGRADEPNKDEEPEIDKSDRLTMDPNSINNNPAARFVPKRNQKPVAPMVSPSSGRDGAVVADESGKVERNVSGQQRPTERGADERTPDRKPLLADRNEAAEQLEDSIKRKAMRQRYQRLLERTEQDVDAGSLQKGYVSVGEVRRPDELRNDFELSSIAGRLTVYGTAYYSRHEIAGFDLAFRDDRDQVFDVVVPTVETGEFKESLVPPPGFRMRGLNVLLDDAGVRGMQCIYSKGARSDVGPWVGQTPGSESVIQLDVVGDLHGLVVYRDGWSVVGLQLITRSSDDPRAQ